MITKFLDPKNDVAFKRIFGTDKNKDILIHFLNDIITCNKRPAIKTVSFLRTVLDPEIAAMKTSFVDILCVDDQDNRYIVEMQVAREKGFEKRAMFYAAKAYTSQMTIGGEYQDLKEVIFIAIADFLMFPHRKGFKSEHMILEKDSHDHDLKDFSFTFLELPKFNKSINELSNMTDKWMYFFKKAFDTSPEDLQKLTENNTILKKAYTELDSHYWTEEMFRTYEQATKYAWGYKASMDQKFDEGIDKGREEGREKGREEGIKKVAKNMASQGIAIDVIASVTGFNHEELTALLSENDSEEDNVQEFRKKL